MKKIIKPTLTLVRNDPDTSHHNDQRDDDHDHDAATAIPPLPSASQSQGRSLNSNSSKTRRPSRQVLAAIVGRAVTFLSAIGTNDGVRAAMIDAGYTKTDHTDGWALVDQATGRSVELVSLAATRKMLSWKTSSPNALIGKLTQDGLLVRARVILEHDHPNVVAHLFHDIDKRASRQTMVDAMMFAHSLRSEAPEIAAAAASLSQRGIKIDELDALVEQIKHAIPDIVDVNDSADRIDHALVALYQWLEVWKAVAHTRIRRRDDLIRLGMARRRMG